MARHVRQFIGHSYIDNYYYDIACLTFRLTTIWRPLCI